MIINAAILLVPNAETIIESQWPNPDMGQMSMNFSPIPNLTVAKETIIIKPPKNQTNAVVIIP